MVSRSKSDLLRRPDDARDQVSYRAPMLGKTDGFVLVFHKALLARNSPGPQ
jgi:hypothetical protein